MILAFGFEGGELKKERNDDASTLLRLIFVLFSPRSQNDDKAADFSLNQRHCDHPFSRFYELCYGE